MAHLNLTFLSAFQATLDDQPITHFRSANVQGILVYLALHPGRAFTRETLTALFWPEESTEVGRANLRQSLYQLRKVLGDEERSARPFLLVTRENVQFNAASDYSLDVTHFTQAIQQTDWQTACVLYTGELLPGFKCESPDFEAWLDLERQHLQKQAQEVMAALTEQQIAQGDFMAAQTTAQRQLILEPWRESAHRQLMQALALAGDRSSALAQFERCYEILEKELGVEPDAATLALYEKIATAVIGNSAAAAEQHLPQPPTTMIGRVAEISYILQLFNKPDCHIVTLIGPGGVGKTRLAIQVAHTFFIQTGKQVRFISLVGVNNLAQAVNVFAQALKISVVDVTQITDQIVEAVTDKIDLLVVDNAEPLLVADGDGFVALLNAISSGAPRVRLLVTSRQPLQVQQEWVLAIHGLARPASLESLTPDQYSDYDALELFCQRAQQARGTFALTASNIVDVAQLCQLLHGLPLALELAAAQVRHKGVAEIVAAISNKPHQLTADLRDLPPRHRSLFMVFEQSWSLLTEAEQKTLRLCALFQGGFGRAAAQAVLGEGAHEIESLAEKSLVQIRHTPNALTRVRYLLAAALHSYLTAVHIDSAGATTAEELIAARDRHAAYYLTWAVEHHSYLTLEQENLAAAWAWAQQRATIIIPSGWNPDWLAATRPSVSPDGGLSATQAAENTLVSLVVGREQELAQLRASLQTLLRQRHNGGLITIIGEAGMGKSHLVAQLRREHLQIAWFDCPCDEWNAQSLLPFRGWLQDYFRQSPGQSTAEKQTAFAARFADLSQATPSPEVAQELVRLRSLLAALVDLVEPDSLYTRLQPEQRYENFAQAIKTLIKAESLLQPAILHLEDAHWIDADSRTLIGNLLRHTGAFPFAIIVTARPQGFEGLTLAEIPQQMVRLETLGREAVAHLVQEWLGSEPDAALLELLVVKGQGNPFLTTQLLHHLADYSLVIHGKLVQTDVGFSADTLLSLETHNILTARLNHLGPDVRTVVNQAAVLGQEFSLPVLRRIVGDEEMLAQSLAKGVSAAIWQPVANERYVFTHALLRDAAYQSQLDEQRRQLHAQAAHAVAATATPGQPQFATIARHYDEANEPRRSVSYYQKAGDQARQNYFLRDAQRYYSRGLTLATSDSERLSLYFGREVVNHWLGNREEQREDLRQLMGLAAASKDKKLLIDVTLRQATFALATADHEKAIHHAQRASILAAAIHDQALEGRAYHLWGRTLWQEGRSQAAQPLLKRALRLAQAAKDTIQQMVCRYDLGIVARYGNQFAEARQQFQEALQLFEEANDKHNVIRCIDSLGTLASEEGDYEGSIAYFQQALQLCQTIDWPYSEAYILANLGNSYFELGDYARCRQMHQQALALARTLKDRRAEVISLDTIGLAYHFEGNFLRAKEQFEAALALHETVNYPRGKAFVQTHFGLALIDGEELEQAALYLYDALVGRDASGVEQIAIDTKAALAWLDLARGDAEFAVEKAHELAAWLEQNGTAGVELPLQVYWQCYRIFAMNRLYVEAQTLLQAAYTLLQTRAQRIQNDALRQQYLTNVPYHRQIMTAWGVHLNLGANR